MSNSARTELLAEIGTGIQVPPQGSTLDQICTPALIVDKDVMLKNIRTMMDHFSGSEIAVRPHLKTGKSPIIAKLLLENGARGVCVAKTGEAYVLAQSGVTDLLITSPVAHSSTAAWLAELVASYPDIKIVVDSERGATTLSDALKKHSLSMRVLIDVNVGQNRTGIAPEKAARLADFVASLGNLEIIGCQGYEGHLQFLPEERRRDNVAVAMKMLMSAVGAIRKKYDAPIVTTAGTGTCRLAAAIPGITEIQPGSFIFMDTTYRKALPESNYANALWVMGTVLSKPASDTATIDVGCKSVSTEYGMPEPQLTYCQYTPAGDEHGTLSGAGAARLQVGERVMIAPSHIDTTVALHELYFVMQNEKLEEVWPIASRGRVQ